MSIAVTCQQCGQSHSVHPRMAGREIRCPSCDAKTLVPAIAEPEAAAEPEAPPAVESTGTEETSRSRWLTADDESAASIETPDAVSPPDAANPPDPLDVVAATPVAAIPVDSSANPEPDDPRTERGGDTSNEASDEDDEDLAAALGRRFQGDDEELDMTAMVDVTFLLLIFFMVTASFSLQKSIPMPRQTSELPSTNSQTDPLDELDVVELEIDEYGSFFVISPDFE